MAGDTGDRQSDGGASTEGADQPRLGQQDIFDEIARNVFTKHGVGGDISQYADWITIIAEEYRIAMAELNVTVTPKGPKPQATRTKNGTLMMLIGALENGDMWIRDCLVPMRQHPDGRMVVASPTVGFDAGQFTVEIAFTWTESARLVTFQQILAIVMQDGTRYTTMHADRAWLAHYRPMPERDVFSPMLQHTLDQAPSAAGLKWSVVGADAAGRLYKWPDGRTPVMWKDARGREL